MQLKNVDLKFFQEHILILGGKNESKYFPPYMSRKFQKTYDVRVSLKCCLSFLNCGAAFILSSEIVVWYDVPLLTLNFKILFTFVGVLLKIYISLGGNQLFKVRPRGRGLK